jgi:phosphatidate phosphatase APP1
MSEKRVTILLNYYAVVNHGQALIFGQLTTKRLSDLTFTSFSGRTTFRTLFSLYRSRALASQIAIIHYEAFNLTVTTDDTGFFMVNHEVDSHEQPLKKITVNDEPVRIIDGLYDCRMHHINTPNIVVSDIDDTILHSHVSRKFRKLRTLMFTPVERRLTVVPVKTLIDRIVAQGATALYLSNSEQNLYPLIYRFLVLNGFPRGPVFLKQMRRLRDLVRYHKLPPPEVHKMKMLNILLPMFTDKQFVLIGDNTQYDLSIYMNIAKSFPDNVRAIYIRKAIPIKDEAATIANLANEFARRNIAFHYGDDFETVVWPESQDLKMPAADFKPGDPLKSAADGPGPSKMSNDVDSVTRNAKPDDGTTVNKP